MKVWVYFTISNAAEYGRGRCVRLWNQPAQSQNNHNGRIGSEQRELDTLPPEVQAATENNLPADWTEYINN